MEMILGLIILLACLVIGVRHGGIGLAVISGIGLVIFTFVFGYKPGNPPIGVMLTILAVVTCAGFLQTSGGLTVMLKYAEKFLRSNPKHVTIFVRRFADGYLRIPGFRRCCLDRWFHGCCRLQLHGPADSHGIHSGYLLRCHLCSALELSSW